jgi:hypothetical protein
MKSLKIELLGLGVILAGVALSLNSLFGIVGAIAGLVVMLCACIGGRKE